ncbi:class I SAM-dependent methyltransferase [bacterium]|nr:class I SAM-dependent methyltransferase [bacterium]
MISSFFQGRALELWLHGITPEQSAAEVDFLAEELRVSPGMHLLDAPCGGGRHAAVFAARGYRVTGVDHSPGMLALARQALAPYAGRCEVVQADLRDIAGEGLYDGAYAFGNSFGYFDREGMAAYLGALARSLKPGAWFVADTALSAESILPTLTDHEWYEAGDFTVLIDNTYHVTENRLEMEYRIYRKGSSVAELCTLCQWVYSLGELSAMLNSAGLELVEAYGSTTREPFRVGSGWLVFTARKTA